MGPDGNGAYKCHGAAGNRVTALQTWVHKQRLLNQLQGSVVDLGDKGSLSHGKASSLPGDLREGGFHEKCSLFYSASRSQQLSSERMSLPVASGCARLAGHGEVFAVCTEIWDGPGRPLVGGSGNSLNSFIVSSQLAKTTLHFMRNAEGVVAALTGQEWCHQRFSEGC